MMKRFNWKFRFTFNGICFISVPHILYSASANFNFSSSLMTIFFKQYWNISRYVYFFNDKWIELFLVWLNFHIYHIFQEIENEIRKMENILSWVCLCGKYYRHFLSWHTVQHTVVLVSIYLSQYRAMKMNCSTTANHGIHSDVYRYLLK